MTGRVIDGAELRARRTVLGVSQYRLAALTGVSSARLSAWELGRRPVPRDDARAVARVVADLEARSAAGEAVVPPKRPGRVAHGRTQAPPVMPGVRTVPEPAADAPTVLTSFSGCGGMAEGFRSAGYRILGYLEKDPDARATFARNFPGSVCVGTDVATVDPAEVRAMLGTRVDVLAGGPPCQGFSLAGKRDPGDPRNLLFRNFLDLADAVGPRVLVMENVRLLIGMRDGDGARVIDRVLGELADRGFRALVSVVDASEYGVPQSRARLIVIATRGGPDPTFPDPTYGPNLLPLRTFRDATYDLPALEAGECSDDPLHWAVDHPEHVLAWLRSVPEGKSAHDNDDPSMRPPSGYNTTYKRLRWDEPSATVGTTFGMISASRTVHPSSTRSLTVREAMRLQTFPDDFVFDGSWTSIRRMIGNAVPPALSRAVADHVAPWLDQSNVTSSTSRCVPSASTPSDPVPAMPSSSAVPLPGTITR